LPEYVRGFSAGKEKAAPGGSNYRAAFLGWSMKHTAPKNLCRLSSNLSTPGNKHIRPRLATGNFVGILGDEK
jgi:hypothetical protein